MANVFQDKGTPLDRLFKPIESIIHRVLGITPETQMNWKEYAQAFVAITACATLFLYLVMRLQTFLPWFYSHDHTDKPNLAVNTGY